MCIVHILQKSTSYAARNRPSYVGDTLKLSLCIPDTIIAVKNRYAASINGYQTGNLLYDINLRAIALIMRALVAQYLPMLAAFVQRS